VIVADQIGEGTASETAVVGETPNLAARLQSLAQPNQKDGFGEGFRMPAHRDLSRRTEGRRRKAPQEGTRGGWSGDLPLWGFDGAAACVGDAPARVGGGGPTIALASSVRDDRRSTAAAFNL
jgi:hypothetical protein